MMARSIMAREVLLFQLRKVTEIGYGFEQAYAAVMTLRAADCV